MALRLDNGESGQLITPLTIQNLAYQGAPNEGVNKPDYATSGGNPVHYINNDDSLTVALAKLGYAFTSRFGDTISGTLTWTNGSGATFASGSTITHASGSAETYASGSSVTFAAGTARFGGAGAGVATLQYASSASSPTFNLPSKAAGTYTIATTAEIPDVSHVTYDNVAETISSIWDFTAGAGFGTGTGRIQIDNNDIYLEGTDAEGQSLNLNRYGYNGGTTRFRNLEIYNGKNSIMFSCVGSGDYINVYSSFAATEGIVQYTDGTITDFTLNIGTSASFENSGITTVYVEGVCDGNGAIWFTSTELVGGKLVGAQVCRLTAPDLWSMVTGITVVNYIPSTGQVIIDIGGSSPWEIKAELKFSDL